MKNFSLLFVFILLPVLALCGFDSDFLNKTLRIDYIRCGNNLESMVSIDEFIQEPSWDRSKVMLIDPFNNGTYKMQAYDSATGDLIFEKHYSSLFYEWQTTPEAKLVNRSFQESVIMPYPKRTILITFSDRNRQNQWDPKLSVYLNPESRYISKESKFEYQTTRIHYSGESSVKLDLVFIAEGYTKGEISKFKKDAQRFANYLLECEPFAKMKDKINIWAVQSVSMEDGADIPGEGVWKRTSMNSTFYTFGSERYLTTLEHKTVRHCASNAPYDQIIVLVNSNKYGGGGFFNFISVISSDNALSNYLLIHEFGHTLCGLGDEYYNSEVAMEEFYSLDLEPWEQNLTTLVDFERKWKTMIDPSVPVPTPEDNQYQDKVGLFEGGGYVAKGVYRPSLDCSMKSTKYNYFCPVCQKAISEMIEFYTN